MVPGGCHSQGCRGYLCLMLMLSLHGPTIYKAPIPPIIDKFNKFMKKCGMYNAKAQ